jgi:hypothetical protein
MRNGWEDGSRVVGTISKSVTVIRITPRQIEFESCWVDAIELGIEGKLCCHM